MKENYTPITNKFKHDHFKAGGFRDMPGVSYPDDYLKQLDNPERDKVVCKPKDMRKWVTTRKAAHILNVTESAARICLHKHKVKCLKVREQGGPTQLIWSKKTVEAIAARRVPLIAQKDADMYVENDEACAILKCGRSSLYRYVNRGTIKMLRCRVNTEHGMRVRCFYDRRELEEVSKLLHELHAAQRETNRLCKALHGLNAMTTSKTKKRRNRNKWTGEASND